MERECFIVHKILRHFSLLLVLSWRLCMRHARKVALLFTVSTVFFALQLPKLTAELRIYDIVDPKFKSTKQLHEMKSQFGDENSILILFSGAGGSALSSENACKIQSWLSHIQDESSAFSQEISGVANPFRLKKLVLTDDRIGFEPILPKFECNKTPFSAQTLLSTPWKGFLTDPSGKDLAVQIGFRDSVGGSRYGKFDPAPIGALWDDLQNRLIKNAPEIQTFLGGRSSFQWYYQKALKRDVLINIVVLFILILFFRIFYGTWKSGLIILAIILFSSVFIFGGMSLFNSPVDYLSNGLFLMMCIAAVEDFVFITHDQLSNPKSSWGFSIRSLILPGFFTSLTTMIGFLSLETADLEIIRRFGFYAGWASLCEWGITFFAIPALLKAFKIQRNWVDPDKAHFGKVVKSISRVLLPKKIIFLSLFFFIGSLFGFAHINFNDSPRWNFVKSHMQHKTYDYLQNSRGWEGPVFVIFSNAYSQSANESALRKIATDPNIIHIENPYEIKNYFLQDFSEDFQKLIKVQLSQSRTYRSSFSAMDTARAVLYLKSINLADLNKTINHVKNICEVSQCFASGEAVVYSEYSNRVIGTLFKSLISSLLLVGTILLFLAFALNAKKKMKILFSVFWGPILIVGGLALFRIPMNLTNSMFASVLVGLAGDNAVQYLFAAKKRKIQAGIDKRSGASVHVTIIAATASLFFLGLTLVPLKILGILLFFGFLISFTGDLWVLNGITRQRT